MAFGTIRDLGAAATDVVLKHIEIKQNIKLIFFRYQQKYQQNLLERMGIVFLFGVNMSFFKF
jgi:hypothetical protein